MTKHMNIVHEIKEKTLFRAYFRNWNFWSDVWLTVHRNSVWIRKTN